jgi:hypothetical protein
MLRGFIVPAAAIGRRGRIELPFYFVSVPNADHGRVEASLVEMHQNLNVGYNTCMRLHYVTFYGCLSPALVFTLHDVVSTNATNDITAHEGNTFTEIPRPYITYVLLCACKEPSRVVAAATLPCSETWLPRTVASNISVALSGQKDARHSHVPALSPITKPFCHLIIRQL